jgi:hypothetical protein
MKAAIVGVAEHGNSAELVTVVVEGGEATLLDRRRVDLTEDLPTHPYHHEGAWALGRYRDSDWSRDVTLEEAIALVEQVTAAATEGASRHLEVLASQLPVEIERIAIRLCAELPDGIEERIRDSRAQTMADSIMYRQALADAADARGWTVVWYDRKQVFEAAAIALETDDLDAVLKTMGRTVGPPWQARHKLAAAAAVAAAAS